MPGSVFIPVGGITIRAARIDRGVPIEPPTPTRHEAPTTLASDKDLKLVIKGRVIFLEAPKHQNSRHRVSLKFENKYIIDEKK